MEYLDYQSTPLTKTIHIYSSAKAETCDTFSVHNPYFENAACSKTEIVIRSEIRYDAVNRNLVYCYIFFKAHWHVGIFQEIWECQRTPLCNWQSTWRAWNLTNSKAFMELQKKARYQDERDIPDLGMQRNSATKRNEVLTHATTWMNVENTVLSEIRQIQKDKYCMIPVTWNMQNRQNDKDSRLEVKRG